MNPTAKAAIMRVVWLLGMFDVVAAEVDAGMYTADDRAAKLLGVTIELPAVTVFVGLGMEAYAVVCVPASITVEDAA